MSQAKSKSREQYKVLTGLCPDDECQAKLYFPAFDKSIECTSCGQRHDRSSLKNVEDVTNTNIALHNLLKNVLLGNVKPRKGPENTKVLGLSNYVCKLLSPILTKYGMDKQTTKAKELPNNFDCAVLGDRAFLIDAEHLSVVGYGLDRSGSKTYLADTLRMVKDVNNKQDLLVPIHADGDGHCLVHAISRALVGRELFWHPLRINLQSHFQENIDKYKELFKDFIDCDEWSDIINECDPDFMPPDFEPHGLRNIHIFGLANVLKRPIVLLDSLEGMQSSGDYSGVFLPVLVPPEDCKKDGILHRPLCIAWSSSGHNHFIPLVGIKGKPTPKLPRYMIQRAWGISDIFMDKYILFDDLGMCSIGGDKFLQDRYIQKLVHAMEEVFLEKFGVHAHVVADVHQFVYKQSGIVGVQSDTVVKATQKAVKEYRLYQCLMCDAITEYNLPADWFQRGGSLYKLAVQSHGELRTDKRYSFPIQGAICTYDKQKDQLVLDALNSKLTKCAFCQGDRIRQVNGDGSVRYQNGDRTLIPSTSTRCTCGFKHFWDGQEYDNFPDILPLKMEWNGREIKEEVAWFQYELDASLNSNVYQVAQATVQKNFPGEFGSELLVQKIVDKLLHLTAIPETKKEVCSMMDNVSVPMSLSMENLPWSAEVSSKIIMTGQQHKSVHKEELTMSQTERNLRHRIESNATIQQCKKSTERIKKDSPEASLELKVPSPSSKTLMDVPTITPATAAPPTATWKKIRLATSDGRQEMLNLDHHVTYNQLQTLIFDVLNVPPHRQRLRLGFPPREIKSSDVPVDQPIQLQHGDKVAVEILPVIKHNPPSSIKGAGSDSIDMSITSMAMLAQLTGRDLWTYCLTRPHLFSVGGLFYKQVERDLGLAPGKHCTLPSLPGKVFRFNADADRLEICLEPYGHFPVEPNIERKVKTAAPVDEDMDIKFGSSGAISKGRSHIAFSGQGHLMRSIDDTRMPTDLPESPRLLHAQRLTNFCDPENHQEAISEEEEGARDQVTGGRDLAGSVNQSEAMVRLGPGVSVVDPTASNRINDSVDVFRQLAEAIEQSVADCNDFEESSLSTKSLSTSSGRLEQPEQDVPKSGSDDEMDTA